MERIAVVIDYLKNLNRSQLSFLITFFSLSIMILLLYNIHLGAEEQEEYTIELSLADEDLQALLEEEEKKAEELANADIIKSNRAINETAKPSLGSPEKLKTLEELLEEKNLNSSDNPTDPLSSDEGYSESLKELAKAREERKKKLGELDAEKEEFTDYLANKRTRISYSLIDRNSYELPPPIYTCPEGGKVVINIHVDALGYVTEVEFNAKSSNTTNGCLIENAKEYALKARFNPATKATQIGTITYLFQGK